MPLTFLGSSFLVHRGRYLLTAAHLVSRPVGLFIVPTSFSNGLAPMTFDHVAGMQVSAARQDKEHDVALLKIDRPVDIEVPHDSLGSTENVRPGASVMSLGCPFGHQQLHTVITMNAVVSAKLAPPTTAVSSCSTTWSTTATAAAL